VILVTGAAGMLGREVVAAAAARGLECVGLARGELDITDAAAVRAAIREYSPETIINCAGWTDVDSAETHEDEALAINRDGTAALADEASARMARLIHVSTDYVFDGTATRPYVESDPTGPSTAYGRTKLAGERAALASSPRHAIARTAWIFGTGRSNFVTFVLEQAASGRPVHAFTDQFGCPTYSVHLAEKLLDMAAQERGGIFHEAASGHCSRHEFAQAILARAGVEGEIVPALRASLPAPRPAWSVLSSERDPQPLPSWQDGLDAFLAPRGAAV
jgi:dTDP-4-dehydrorhamnose reductase